MSNRDNDVWVVGRKAIIEYLRPKLALADNMIGAWSAIRRWRQNYGFDKLIRHLPNGKPYLIKADFELWWAKYREIEAKRKASERGLNR